VRWTGRDVYLESCISDVGHSMAANRLKLNTDKTELLWAGSKSGSAPLGGKGQPFQLGSEVIAAGDHVRLLGVTVTVSSDLCLQMCISFTGRTFLSGSSTSSE